MPNTNFSADPYDWQKSISESVDEMLRIVDEAESYIYDYIFPSLLKSKGTADERAFYQNLDWNSLQSLSPKLFTKYSERALSLEEDQRAASAKALDELSYGEFEQGRQFRPQIQTPNILGMRAPGSGALTTQGQGLDLPMGVFGQGPQ